MRNAIERMNGQTLNMERSITINETQSQGSDGGFQSLPESTISTLEFVRKLSISTITEIVATAMTIIIVGLIP